MKRFKIIFCLLLCVVIPFSLCSCKTAEVNRTVLSVPFSKLSIPNKVSSGVVCENDKFVLQWDSDNVNIKLISKENGRVWSNIPEKFIKSGVTEGKAYVSMNSPIDLRYVNQSNMSSIKNVTGYSGVIKKGSVGSSSIENGIKVYYSFEKLQIIIPVSYVLTDDGLKISVNPKEIIEYDNLVLSISLLPFLCSSENSDSKDNYLVVPSGSGALMYTDNRESGERSYGEAVYGDDLSCYQSEKFINTETVRLPFYSAKDGNDMLCCIIENGAPSAEIKALSGDSDIGFSNVYTTFHIRGSNISPVSYQGGNIQEVETVCESICGYKELTLGCYPLTDEKATYSGAAEKYREKLIASDKKADESNLTLNIIGGVQLEKLFLGIPHKETEAATTFNQAKDIVEKIKSDCDAGFDVVLKGFGSTGIDIGKIGGGFTFADVCGSKSDFASLKSYCKKSNIPLYLDFDIVRYNSSSSGFSKTFDSAKTSNMFTAYQYLYSPALRQKLDDSKYVLLTRNKLSQASDKAFEFAKDSEISNIGFSTLGNMAYSDYSSVKYYVRSSTESDFEKIVKSAKKNKLNMLVSGANGYAAALADKLTDAPVNSSAFDSLDVDIPLYQIVFKGITDISNKDINLCADEDEAILKAVEGGSGLAFTVINDYNTEFATTTHSELATSLFKNNKELICKAVKKTSSFYNEIRSATISEHKILSDDLRMTVFSNGTAVIVNYSRNEVNTDYGKVNGRDFIIIKEGD